jgi:H+/gluconate symporter-like permease
VLLQCRQKQKKQEQQNQQKNTKNQYTTNDKTAAEKKQKQHRLFWLLLSVIMGVVGIVVFFLTEDMSRSMAMVDKWTIVNAIILAVEIIAIVFTFKHNKNNNKNDPADKKDARSQNNTVTP